MEQEIEKIIQIRLKAIEDSIKSAQEILADIHSQCNLVTYLLQMKDFKTPES